MEENKPDVNIIAIHMNNSFSFVKKAIDIAPTEKELEFFEKYLNQSESLGPLLNPTAFMKKPLFEAIRENHKRIKLIRALRKHFKETTKILNKVE